MARRRYTLKWKPKKPVAIKQRAWRKAMRTVAEEMQESIKAKVVKTYPPASRPWSPPANRTGGLRESVDVSQRGDKVTIRSVFYAKYLEEGTSNMSPRPFIRPALFTPQARKRWIKRIAKVAKKKR